jgi:leucyl aminopeptidase
MKIQIKKGRFAEFSCEAAVVILFEDCPELSGMAALMNEQSGGLIRDLVKSGDFQGKLFQISVLYTGGNIPARRIVTLGLGKKTEFNMEKLRGAYAKAAQHIRSLGLKCFAVSPDTGLPEQDFQAVTEAIVEGVLLGLYRFTPFKTVDRDKIKDVEEFTIVEEKEEVLKAVRSAAGKAETAAGAVCYVRDLVSTPANELTPTDLSNEAREIAMERKRIKVKVLDTGEMKELGMNALLGVSRGSHEPAKFIILEYHGGTKSDPPIALVGKGLTFDSGGISIKPSEKMDEMKSDMAGGAAVMGTIRAAADLGLPVNLVGLIPATENLPGGGAYKPGDILKSLSGQTIEVINTDAEGRLILADALTYAGRFKPAVIIDLATLTGACIVALGEHVIGMMGNDDNMKKKIREAGEATGERVWELPLWEEYQELIKSDVADYKNTGGRSAGTITAAVFLSKFVGEYPWVHLDIAGPAWQSKDSPYIPKGASGVGVRLLIEFLREWTNIKKD